MTGEISASPYQREPEKKWRASIAPIRGIEDSLQRAIQLIRLALGEGATFLAAADRSLGIDLSSAERAADFFETAEATAAIREVAHQANRAFNRLPLKDKLTALEAVMGSNTEDDRG